MGVLHQKVAIPSQGHQNNRTVHRSKSPRKTKLEYSIYF